MAKEERTKSSLKRFVPCFLITVCFIFATFTSFQLRIKYTIQTILFLFQRFWRNSEGEKISRDHLIMVLQQVKAIVIRATYNTQMLQTTYEQ